MICPNCGYNIRNKQVQSLNEPAERILQIFFDYQCPRCYNRYRTIADYTLNKEIFECVDAEQ